VTGIGRLGAGPRQGGQWEFSVAEYRRRLDGLRRGMATAGLDCVLVTSERNMRYLTSFHTQVWVSPTRPRFVLIPASGEPVAVVPRSNVEGFALRSWIEDVRWWPAPRPADEGVSLLAETIRELVGRSGRVGAELGPETRLGMPVADFLTLRERLAGIAFADAGGTLQRLRMVKSAEEIATLRRIAGIASDAFARLAEGLAAGQSERDVHRRLHGLLVDLGADTVPYLVPVSGPSGYDHINMGPTDRVLRPGDVLVIDVGASLTGYCCDFDRNFAIGHAADDVAAAYRRTFEATEAGLAAVRPGCTAADVYRAMSEVLQSANGTANPIGRMGHGLGLDLTEPPSIAATDETRLDSGMVITLEPCALLSAGGGMAQRLMVHEENLVVTPTGYELLSRRASPVLPIV
jgi:Xaa-Pro aminopeptidase